MRNLKESLDVSTLKFYYHKFNHLYFDSKLPKRICIRYKSLPIYHIDEPDKRKALLAQASEYANNNNDKDLLYAISFNNNIDFVDFKGQLGVLLHEMNHIYEFIYERDRMSVDIDEDGCRISTHGDSFMKNVYADRIRSDGYIIEAHTPCFNVIKDSYYKAHCNKSKDT